MSMDFKAQSLDKTLRGSFTVDKLLALKTIVNAGTPTISTGEIGSTLGTASESLGGHVSSLIRTRINDQPLVSVVAMGDNRQRLIKYNEKIAPKNLMVATIDGILADLK